MNRSESKYFNTALRMDEALIALLAKKDLEYITVREICHQAGVNRSTFYLHYETIADLLNETLEMINQRFLSYFPQKDLDMPSELATTMTSARYKTTVIIDITNVAAALSSLLFIAERRTIESTAFTITSPKSANATVRAITSPPS